MSVKYTLLLCLVTAVVVAVTTKYYFPTIQTKTTEVIKEIVRTDIQTVTHTVTLPGGAIETTTTTTDHSVKTETDNKTSVVAKKATTNISALIGNDFSRSGILPLYGVSVSKEILGPVTLGVFGLITNGVIGLSVGVNF